jgi:hypothetical protein
MVKDICNPQTGNACPEPFVLTIDIAHVDVDSRVRSEPSIELLEGSSTGTVVRKRLDMLFRNPERPRNAKSRAPQPAGAALSASEQRQRGEDGAHLIYIFVIIKFTIKI